MIGDEKGQGFGAFGGVPKESPGAEDQPDVEDDTGQQDQGDPRQKKQVGCRRFQKL